MFGRSGRLVDQTKSKREQTGKTDYLRRVRQELDKRHATRIRVDVINVMPLITGKCSSILEAVCSVVLITVIESN